MKTETRLLLPTVALGVALALLAQLSTFNFQLRAQTVPALVNYQGRLANPDGSPLPTADYTLTFNLYDAATNGARVWGPQIFDGAVAQGHGARVPVVQGWFNVMLGPVDTNGASLADAFNGASRYVEVIVSNRPPIAPRQQILTTPFAFQAANSAKLAGYDWSAVFGTNNPVAGTIPFNKLAQREVGTNVGIGGVAVSRVCEYWSSPSPTTTVAVSNLVVNLQTTGRPVVAFLTSSPTNDFNHTGYINAVRSVIESGVYVQLFRDGVMVSNQYAADRGSSYGTFSPGAFQFFEATVPSGSHTYEIRASGMVSGTTILEFAQVRLVAFEL